VAHVQIFLSAVSAEFEAYRDRVRRELSLPNVTVKIQEEFVPTGTETLDKLDLYIQDCDAVIHLVGNMTGAEAQWPSVALIRERYPDFAERLPAVADALVPGGPALTYTQWEAWLTLYHRKVLLIAKAADGAQRSPRYTLNAEQQARQQAHLARLAADERYSEIGFNDVNDLTIALLKGLQGVLARVAPPVPAWRRTVALLADLGGSIFWRVVRFAGVTLVCALLTQQFLRTSLPDKAANDPQTLAWTAWALGALVALAVEALLHLRTTLRRGRAS